MLSLPNVQRRERTRSRLLVALLFTAKRRDKSLPTLIDCTLIVTGVDSRFQRCPATLSWSLQLPDSSWRQCLCCSWADAGAGSPTQLSQSLAPGCMFQILLLSIPWIGYPARVSTHVLFSPTGLYLLLYCYVCVIPSLFCIFKPWTQNAITFSNKPWGSSKYSAKCS